LPQFAETHYTDSDSVKQFSKVGCFVVDYETDYIIWQKDAWKKYTTAAIVLEEAAAAQNGGGF